MPKNNDSMDEMIAKVGLATKITDVALNCGHCKGTVEQLIRDYKKSVGIESVEYQSNKVIVADNLQEGGPSTGANRLTERVIKNDILQKSN